MGRFKAREHSEQQSLALSTTSTVVSLLGRAGAGAGAAPAGRPPNETITPASRVLLSCLPWLAARGCDGCWGSSLAPSRPGASLPIDGGRGGLIALLVGRKVRGGNRSLGLGTLVGAQRRGLLVQSSDLCLLTR